MPSDGRYRLAKVGVAGSNPVVRSKGNRRSATRTAPARADPSRFRPATIPRMTRWRRRTRPQRFYVPHAPPGSHEYRHLHIAR